MLVSVFVLMLVISVMVVIVSQIITDRSACRAAESCADQTAGGATNAVANHLTARGPKTSANG